VGNGCTARPGAAVVGERAQHPAGDVGPEHRLSRGHRADRTDDPVAGGALDQIATGAGTHRGEHGLVVVEHRQHQYRRLSDQPAGRFDARYAGHV
jgi:hypothetical protein